MLKHPWMTNEHGMWCQACGEQRVLCLDHCHETGRFRGWICHPCNLDDVLADDAPPLTPEPDPASDIPF